MMRWVWQSRNNNDEAGFALLMVVGMTLVLMGLLVVGVTVTINSLRSSRTHSSFESALAVAEAGVDKTLAILQVDSSYNPCACSFSASVLATASSEQAAAKSKLLTYANSLGTLPKTNQGDYVAIRPLGAQKVFAMSWVPSRSTPGAKTRFIKAEYLFSPFKPGNALAAQSDIVFDGGSVTVEQSGTTCPNAAAAPVHSNGNITGTANSNCITGDVTASGSYAMSGTVGSGSGGGTPLETIPIIDPRAIYTSADVNADPTNTTNWYDLCPDGKVRAKAAATPCTGSVLADTTLTTVTPGYRGWMYSKSGNLVTWNMGFPDSPYSGIYYVYQGDAYVNGGTTGQNLAWNATVLAEPLVNGAPGSSATCNKLGGNINWHNTDINSFLTGTVLIAGADLDIQASSNTLQRGLFAASDQVYMDASSATTVTGAVIASDTCRDSSHPNELQGITLNFDTNFEAPVKSIVRTTQWIELTG
jgi:hypothetical protein